MRADDIYLSPASGRDSAYIAVHMYKGMAYRAYFDATEGILRAYGGLFLNSYLRTLLGEA